jgi:hypothetical protein
MKRYGLPVVLIAVVGVLLALFAFANGSNHTSSASIKGPLLGDKHPNQGQTHIPVGASHVAYNSELPSSGPHYASPTPWGIKYTSVVDETLVHNEEHGGIVIAYRPDLPADQLANLKQVVQKLPASSQFNEVKVVLVPRAANVKPIELAAWTYTYDLDSVDVSKIIQFYNDHLDNGPELVP